MAYTARQVIKTYEFAAENFIALNRGMKLATETVMLSD